MTARLTTPLLGLVVSGRRSAIALAALVLGLLPAPVLASPEAADPPVVGGTETTPGVSASAIAVRRGEDSPAGPTPWCGRGWPRAAAPPAAASSARSSPALAPSSAEPLTAPFTRITSGDLVTIAAYYPGAGCWGDYDDDGWLDVFVNTWIDSERNYLYHNEHDGTFAMVDDAAMPKSPSNQHGCAWGDYDNDGHVDLIVTAGNPLLFNNMLYQNEGDGTFSWATDNPIYTETTARGLHGPSWGDYDNDGLIDLFIAGHDVHNRLFHNDGAGAFTRITDHPFVNDVTDNSEARAFVDYDDDGDLDLYVANVYVPEAQIVTSVLYRNEGDGVFTRVADSGLSDVPGNPFASASCWADYDSDGLQDLFLANTDHNSLYHNDGGGTFSRVDDSPMVTEVIYGDEFFASCAWGDYDNDGSIDLVLTSVDYTLHQRRSFLYRNDGDGTFTKVTEGELVAGNVGGHPSWVDYDNDGFLDLFLARLAQFEGRQLTHFLYHNDGNANAWLNVKLVGTRSNRSAIGAKVRVQAFDRGASRWQLREISGGDAQGHQQSLNAEFGLGDATSVDTLRVEWPSGAVQELTGVAPRQFLTITELLGNGKVLVCHKGKKTRLIRERALPAHLDHGDTEGFCPEEGAALACHRGKKTKIARGKSLAAHLRHGDTLGACQG